MDSVNGRRVLDHGFSLPRGRRMRRALISDPTMEYLLYVPRSARAGAEVLVSLHGISRNAEQHAEAFAPLCESRGVVLVVPVFTSEFHGDYQRLGRRGRGERTDLLLHRILVEVAYLTAADTSCFALFGYSAGAQMAHRYAMAHPHRVTRVVAAAAGWYTFPDVSEKFPYGIRPVGSLPGLTFCAEEFLRVPVHVLVGDRDVSTRNLRDDERIVRRQGATRIERAQKWVAAMQRAAARHDVPASTTLELVPGVRHSFAGLTSRKKVMRRVARFLLDGTSRGETSGPLRSGPEEQTTAPPSSGRAGRTATAPTRRASPGAEDRKGVVRREVLRHADRAC